MWTIESIKDYCKELSDIVGDEFDLPISINGRLTRTLGRVISTHNSITGYSSNTRMEISRSLLETSTEESIKSVIAHEWAHYYTTKSTHENHGHDAVFKANCALIGCSNSGTQTKVERTVEVHSKYEVFCPTCNKIIGGYSRKCATIDRIALCTCKNCRKNGLKVIQNW